MVVYWLAGAFIGWIVVKIIVNIIERRNYEISKKDKNI